MDIIIVPFNIIIRLIRSWKNIISKQITDENCMILNEKGEMVPNYDITIINFDEGDILKGKVSESVCS